MTGRPEWYDPDDGPEPMRRGEKPSEYMARVDRRLKELLDEKPERVPGEDDDVEAPSLDPQVELDSPNFVAPEMEEFRARGYKRVNRLHQYGEKEE